MEIQKDLNRKFKIENLVWCRDLDTEKLDVEVSVAVTLDKKRENQIPKDSQYLLFVTASPEGVSNIEEIALGSDKTISLLDKEELEEVKSFVRNHFYKEVVPDILFTIDSNIKKLESSMHGMCEKQLEYLRVRKSLFEQIPKSYSESGDVERNSLEQRLLNVSSQVKTNVRSKDVAERSL